MLRKWLFGLLLVVTFPATALAAGSDLLFNDSPELVWTSLDLIQKGVVPPTNVYPISTREFTTRYLQEEIAPSPAIDNDFSLVLRPVAGGFSMPFADFNENAWYMDPVRHVPYGVLYLADSAPSFVSVMDDFYIGDWLHARYHIDLSYNTQTFAGRDMLLSFNPLILKTAMEYSNWPKEGFMTLSLPHFDATAGKLRTGIGHGFFGNTFLNGKADYYDQVQFTYYSPKMKFFYMLGNGYTFLSPTEWAAQTADWEPLDHEGTDADPYSADERVKLFAYHRFEWNPWQWLTFGIGEMVITGGRQPEFQKLNPFGLWHNTRGEAYTNVMGMLDMSAVPFKGLQLFGEFTFDDVRLSIEDVNAKPTSLAWQIGAKYVLPLHLEGKHLIGAEFTHVDPWTYNRWQPYLTMYQRQLLQGTPVVVMDYPLGYAYGGDLNQYGGYYQWVRKDGTGLKVSYGQLDKGQIDLGINPATGQPYYDRTQWDTVGTSPTGVVEHHRMLGVSGVFCLSERFSLNANVQADWITNYRHVEGETATQTVYWIGLEYRF